MNAIPKLAIIPEPVSLVFSSGKYNLRENSIICYHKNLMDLAEFLKDLLYPATGFDLEIKELDKSTNNDNSINLILTNEDITESESYSLKIMPNQINISANNPAGIFYGIQTLRQLFPVEIESDKIVKSFTWEIPCLEIEDHPRFKWRGYMLDEARHFQGKNVVKKLLDLLSLHKMNVFHWHLTDDQGWRIEIKKYPKLTEIGSKRTETQFGGRLSKKRDGTPHEGYYSQEDIKEIIEYAKKRFIKIIPEVDLPGHSTALLASYPNLSCKEESLEVSTHWGFHKDVLCVGKEEVFEYMNDILKEIMDLFPSNIIHIGGDEVLKERWRECSYCQNRIKSEGLKDENQLQSYFINRISNYLKSNNQRVICWNDVLDKKLKVNIICQYWFRGKKKMIDYIKNGGDVIMSDFKYTYLDHSYSFTPLKLAYNFEPIPKKLSTQYYKHILGLEAPMWTEFAPNTKRLEWQTFPRLLVFAELGWTPKYKKNYALFHQRLLEFLKRLDYIGINYANLKEIKGSFFKRLFKWLTLMGEEKGGT
ncbi:MAG: beta-N-acetylhexosaminidase [Candidatus Hermodarchaeota archaeon]